MADEKNNPKKGQINIELDENISSVIIDWLDSNQEISFSGAEDNEYLNLSPAYRSADQEMQDVSELLLLKGVDFDSGSG